MSIITRSYFKGPLQLANVDDPDKGLLGKKVATDDFIARYEREILIKTLGYPLYKLFIAEFEILDDTTGVQTIKSGAAAKWKNLFNVGEEYTSGGETVFWRGMVFKDTILTDPATIQYDQSYIASYVFAMQVLNTEIDHAGVGWQGAKAKNATRVSGRQKYVSAYNDAVRLIQESRNNEVSLYRYIMDKNQDDPTTYPNWKGENFEFKNRFGL